jgi:protoporphyrinogen oxidase
VYPADGPGAPAGRRWGIVGGGVLGMTLAHRLAERGHAVTILEAEARLGGLCEAWRLGDVTWDRHYHVILAGDAHLRALLAELGLERHIRWVAARTGFYADGRLHSISSALEFLRFPVLSLPDKLRLALTILRASRITDWRPLERVPVADWLGRWSGRRTLERVWIPLLRAKLGDSYPRVSAAFIWATIVRLYSARRGARRNETFGYVPGGYARIIDRFAAVLAERGVALELGRPVRRVEAAGPGRIGIEYGDGRRAVFDRVVLTTPSHLAARLCPDLTAVERSRLNAIEYQGIICPSLLLRRPLAGFYVTNIVDAWVPFSAVIEMSALVEPRHLGGYHLVYLPKYLAPDDPAFALPDTDLQESFVGALARMFPGLGPEDLRCFRVSRVRSVFALPTLGYSERLPPMRTSLPGLSVINSAHIVNGTLNVNETVGLAETALAEILESTDGPPARSHLVASAPAVR